MVYLAHNCKGSTPWVGWFHSCGSEVKLSLMHRNMAEQSCSFHWNLEAEYREAAQSARERQTHKRHGSLWPLPARAWVLGTSTWGPVHSPTDEHSTLKNQSSLQESLQLSWQLSLLGTVTMWDNRYFNLFHYHNHFCYPYEFYIIFYILNIQCLL